MNRPWFPGGKGNRVRRVRKHFGKKLKESSTEIGESPQVKLWDDQDPNRKGKRNPLLGPGSSALSRKTNRR